MRFALAFAGAALTARDACAFEGHYVGGDATYRQELDIVKLADGRFSVTAVVGTEGCSGLVEDAVGAANGDTLRAEKQEDGNTCLLFVRRTTSGVSVDDDECRDFHGQACEFRGNYRRQRR